MNARRSALVPFCLLAVLVPAAGAAAEIKGSAILEHPCGKVAVKHMGLVKAGKMEEAQKLGSPEMQKMWTAMPAEDRKMMSEMMQAMAKSETEFSAEIQQFGVLEVDGKTAQLTVTKEMKDGNGSGTETMTQTYAIDGKTCLITP